MSRKPLHNQIKSARRFYLIEIGKNRYSVYAQRKSGLDVLWPSDTHLSKSKELIPGMVYSKRRTYPAYHFHLPGYGFSRMTEIKSVLEHIAGHPVELLKLSGAMPTHND